VMISCFTTLVTKTAGGTTGNSNFPVGVKPTAKQKKPTEKLEN
jgi:hypothetical protein